MLRLMLDTRTSGYTGSTPSPPSFPLQANTWHHVAVSDDGAGHKFYFNGELVWSTGYNLSYQDVIRFNVRQEDDDVSNVLAEVNSNDERFVRRSWRVQLKHWIRTLSLIHI